MTMTYGDNSKSNNNNNNNNLAREIETRCIRCLLYLRILEQHAVLNEAGAVVQGRLEAECLQSQVYRGRDIGKYDLIPDHEKRKPCRGPMWRSRRRNYTWLHTQCVVRIRGCVFVRV